LESSAPDRQVAVRVDLRLQIGDYLFGGGDGIGAPAMIRAMHFN
jgi:hypothetical protein